MTMTTAAPPTLLPHHLEKLVTESGLSPEAIAARGYRSVTDRNDQTLIDYGFAPYQRLTPGLLIPGHGVDGPNSRAQFRPDQPRIRKKRNGKRGEPVKYETPAGAANWIDVPPSVRDILDDPTVPLSITEGPIKADAGASHDVPTVSIQGVANWRGQNAKGGIVALPDFNLIALKGRVNGREVHRDVRIEFDSDAADKPEVEEQAQQLARFLTFKGARVRIVRFTSGPNGEKVALDDYFVGGHTLEDHDALVDEAAIVGQVLPLDDVLDQMTPGIAAARAEIASLKEENRRLWDENRALKTEGRVEVARDTEVAALQRKVEQLTAALTEESERRRNAEETLTLERRIARSKGFSPAVRQAMVADLQLLEERRLQGRLDDAGFATPLYRGLVAHEAGVSVPIVTEAAQVLTRLMLVDERPAPDTTATHTPVMQRLRCDYRRALAAVAVECEAVGEVKVERRGRKPKSEPRNVISTCPEHPEAPAIAICGADGCGTVLADNLVTGPPRRGRWKSEAGRKSISTAYLRDGAKNISTSPPTSAGTAPDWQPGQATLRFIGATSPPAPLPMVGEGEADLTPSPPSLAGKGGTAGQFSMNAVARPASCHPERNTTLASGLCWICDAAAAVEVSV